MMKEELKGLLQQNEAWKQILEDLENENVSFKTKLTDILATDFHKGQLPHLELFQSRFLKMDGQISLLRHEIGEYATLLKQPFLTDNQVQSIRDLRKGLEVRIFAIRENLELLSVDFYAYLADAFPRISIKQCR